MLQQKFCVSYFAICLVWLLNFLSSKPRWTPEFASHRTLRSERVEWKINFSNLPAIFGDAVRQQKLLHVAKYYTIFCSSWQTSVRLLTRSHGTGKCLSQITTLAFATSSDIQIIWVKVYLFFTGILWYLLLLAISKMFLHQKLVISN